MNPITSEAAYALGILWADGSMIKSRNAIRLEMIAVDADEIKHIFMTGGKWGVSYRQRKNRQLQCTIGATSKMLFKFLSKYNYISKSYSTAQPIIDIIPPHLRRYWFRGLFDGDGCFYIDPKNVYQTSIAGPYEQDWTFIETLYKNLNIKYRIARRVQGRNKSSIIQTTSKKEFVAVGQYLYGDRYDGIGLKRKYDKWNEINYKS